MEHHGLIALAMLVLAATRALDVEPHRTFQFDPIELLARRDVPGRAELVVVHEGFAYRFTSGANLAALVADPQRHAARMDGACARVGALGMFGDPDIWLVYDGRLYFFRTEECRRVFAAAPEQFLPQPATATPSDARTAARQRGPELLAQARMALSLRSAYDCRGS